MVVVKLKNVSINNGRKFRTNQNYTMIFWNKDGINSNSTIDDIKKLIDSNYSKRVILTKHSKIEIL